MEQFHVPAGFDAAESQDPKPAPAQPAAAEVEKPELTQLVPNLYPDIKKL